MPLTAPDVSVATADKWIVTFKFQDATGDPRSEAYTFNTLPTNANIQALAVAIGAGSNAELYEVRISHIWASVPDTANAIAAPKESVTQNWVFLAKNPAGDTRNLFLPAPIASTFITNTDELDPASPAILNVLAAWVNLLPAGFGIVSGRFSGRREKNKAVKI